MTTEQGQPTISQLIDLTGQRAVVVNASAIGPAIAGRLAGSGAAVALTAGNPREGGPAAASLAQAGYRVSYIEGSLRQDGEAAAAFGAALKALGGVDILVNCAVPGAPKKLAGLTADDFAAPVESNLQAAFIFAREAAKVMEAQETGGVIVNVFPVSAVRPFEEALSTSNASVGGLVSFTKSLAWELSGKRVRVNAVAYGDFGRERGVLRRLQQPDEVARVVGFLVSGLAAHMTGSLVIADNGLSVA
jgi:NAD(P)-dependent dehydrogenase (short-subunit alcohol dehydrogenase family)